MDEADMAQIQIENEEVIRKRQATAPKKKVMVCEDCHKLIPEKRLAIHPYASRCIECQMALESE